MKRLLISLIAAVSFSNVAFAQELPPIGETNMTHGYELVGTIDGCRVWKIDFWGSNVYMTRCPGTGESLSNAQWNKSCGKGCYRSVTNSASNEN